MGFDPGQRQRADERARQPAQASTDADEIDLRRLRLGDELA